MSVFSLIEAYVLIGACWGVVQRWKTVIEVKYEMEGKGGVD